MKRRPLIGSALLFLSVLALGSGLAAWKQTSLEEADAAAASQPEPMEVVTAAVAGQRQHLRTTTSVGTVLALRSVTLSNEVPGTVREVALRPGEIVEAGAVLVALDVSVEEAELRAREAEARLAETLLGRVERASENRAAAAAEVDRARAQLDVAKADVQRLRAVIERKTIRAPFRARIGLSNVHVGQYLVEGSQLTTLQSVDDAVHVDFTAIQDVAANLAVGDRVTVLGAPGTSPVEADIVAIDARVDPRTRNAMVRARIDAATLGRTGLERLPAPGSAVRVRVPIGESAPVVVVPVSALRRGPAGDHVFVLQADEGGATRAFQRMVVGGPTLGDEVVVRSGIAPGEQVAASGSFKLYDGVLVANVGSPMADATGAEAAEAAAPGLGRSAEPTPLSPSGGRADGEVARHDVDHGQPAGPASAE